MSGRIYFQDGSGNTQFVSATNPLPVTGGGAGGSNASVGTNSSAAPTSSTLIGGSDGTNLQPLQVDSNKNLKVNLVGSNQLTCALQNVTTSGTRVQLPNIPCREVTVIARKSNTGSIYAGDLNVSSSVFGVELGAKDSFTFSVNNANLIWLDCSVSGEGVSYVAI